jgi:hypothetical protein
MRRAQNYTVVILVLISSLGLCAVQLSTVKNIIRNPGTKTINLYS